MKKIIVLLVMFLMPILVQAQVWQYTAAMNTTHWLSEMVVLDNQTALIVGGFDQNQRNLSSCEIYDPNTAQWSYTGSLNVARSYPMLVKLANGHVLSMCGGTVFGTGAATNVVEDYDPSTGQWTIVGHLLDARFVPTATLLQDGRVLLVGGLVGGGTTASCEIYDPQTNMSVATGNMAVSRYVHQTVILTDGKVLVTGGIGSAYFSECELFDPATGTWSTVGSMQQSRAIGVLNCFSDNFVLAAGGRNTTSSLANGSEEFDPNTLTWQSTSSIKEPIHWTAGISLPGDRYMATGGIIDGPLTDPYGLIDVTTSKCEWYDRSLKQWYYAPELNLTRCRHNGVYIHQTENATLPTDFLLVAGGQMGDATLDSSGFHSNGGGFTNTAEILDVTQPALKAYMKLPVNGGSAGVRTTSENNINFSVSYMSDGSIKVNYLLASDDNMKLEIMSVDGQTSKRIMNSSVNNGAHSIIVTTNDLTAGAYFMHYSTSSVDRIFKFIVR